MSGGKEIPELRKLGHDLNNVWAMLLGNVELLEMDLPDHSPLNEYVQSMIEAIDTGEAITQKVRAIAHGESPDTTPLPSPPPPTTATDDAADKIPDTSNIELHCRVIDDDHRQLEAMIQQLLETSSAADAIQRMEALFTLSLHHFYREEQLSHHCPEYPFAANHHRTHCALLSRLNHLQTTTRLHGLDKKVLVELADLLALHILGMDAGLKSYISAKPDLMEFVPALPPNSVLEAYFELPPSSVS
ncbi:MAG: hemerythrin family protein [Mariprofundales bacterium]